MRLTEPYVFFISLIQDFDREVVCRSKKKQLQIVTAFVHIKESVNR